MTGLIDTERFSVQLRARGIDSAGRRLLVTRLDGSEQEQDLSEPTNCAGLGRLRHFHRATASAWPENPLPIDPAARALGLSASDELRAQAFQNAICNWRCWYCYVDFPLLSGNREHSEMRSAGELIDLFLDQPDPPAVIDLTGGQPDLVPEWVPWTLEALAERGLSDRVYVWSDDNLSNDYFFTHLSSSQRDLLDRARNYGKVCCFKGFDPDSFTFNTGAHGDLFDQQFALMARLLGETAIDVYAYATFTAPTNDRLPKLMAVFIDRLQELDRNLPLRLIPLQVAAFSPTRSRLTDTHRRALATQEEAIIAWNEQLTDRFDAAERQQAITDVALRAA